MHRLNRRNILINNRLHCATTIANIAQNATCQTQISISIDKHLDIHHIAQLLILEDQNTIDNNHTRRLHQNGLLHTIVLDKRIYGVLDRHVVLQCLQVFDQHLRIERLRVVVVELRALLVGQFVVRLIVEIVAEGYNVVALKSLAQSLYQCTLARTRSAGNSNDRYVHNGVVFSLLLYEKIGNSTSQRAFPISHCQ